MPMAIGVCPCCLQIQIQAGQPIEHFLRSVQGAATGIGQRLQCPERGHDAVADEFIDHAAVVCTASVISEK